MARPLSTTKTRNWPERADTVYIQVRLPAAFTHNGEARYTVHASPIVHESQQWEPISLGAHADLFGVLEAIGNELERSFEGGTGPPPP